MNDNVRPLFGENIAAPNQEEDVSRLFDRAKGAFSAALVLGVNKDTGVLEARVVGLDVPQAMWLMEQFKFAILATNVPENFSMDTAPVA